jgi:GNAT superfamily N-acetyltransferase
VQGEIRPRRRTDLSALAEVLLAQQPATRYPFRDPLPIPVERFLHADDAVAAWTAEVGGRPVGHACFTQGRDDFPGYHEMSRACAEAHGCEVERLAWVSAFFVDQELRGQGLGRRLLAAVVGEIRRRELFACLEVLPVHPGALALYRATGWVEVMRTRPEWLTAEAGDTGPDVVVMVLPDQSRGCP